MVLSYCFRLLNQTRDHEKTNQEERQGTTLRQEDSQKGVYFGYIYMKILELQFVALIV